MLLGKNLTSISDSPTSRNEEITLWVAGHPFVAACRCKNKKQRKTERKKERKKATKKQIMNIVACVKVKTKAYFSGDVGSMY
jgi:hypothetical protein